MDRILYDWCFYAWAWVRDVKVLVLRSCWSQGHGGDDAGHSQPFIPHHLRPDSHQNISKHNLNIWHWTSSEIISSLLTNMISQAVNASAGWWWCCVVVAVWCGGHHGPEWHWHTCCDHEKTLSRHWTLHMVGRDHNSATQGQHRAEVRSEK